MKIIIIWTLVRHCLAGGVAANGTDDELDNK
jgi:hypothetical protein